MAGTIENGRTEWEMEKRTNGTGSGGWCMNKRERNESGSVRGILRDACAIASGRYTGIVISFLCCVPGKPNFPHCIN